VSVTSGALFAGYGGLSMAVEAVLGANLRWVSDIPAYDKEGHMVGNAPAILAHRYPGVPNLGDITTIDWDTVPRVDIIDGGSPCQDVSSAGKRAGMVDGTRSNLWVAMRDAIATIQPAFVIWENVRGALSAPAASAMESDPGLLGDHRGVALRAAGRVLGDLADLGFDAEWEGLRAADVGAPHARFRVFVLAAHPERVARLERRLTVAGQAPPWRALSTTPRRDRAPITLLPTPRAADGFATMGAPGAARHVAAGNGSLAEVIGVDLLPTPTATPYGSNRSASDGATVRPSLAAVDTLFPTPRATDGTKGGPGQRGSSGDLMLPSAVAMLPTPTAHDAKSTSPAQAARKSPGLDAIEHLLPTPRTVRGGSGTETIALLPTPTTAPMTGNGHARFGKYAPAVHRWEQIVGPAPAPTKPGRNGKPRLNPEFASWLMGLPPGWITDTPGLTDNQALHAAGNGCVPQQVAAALEICLRRMHPPLGRIE
jgi:DNA (cytosine-5)-methyltransferase 1